MVKSGQASIGVLTKACLIELNALSASGDHLKGGAFLPVEVSLVRGAVKVLKLGTNRQYQLAVPRNLLTSLTDFGVCIFKIV